MRMLMIFLILMIFGATVFFAHWLNLGTVNSGEISESVSANRPEHTIQTFISYSIRFITTLLSLFTIFVTTATVTRDIKRREIFTIATKPVSRLGYLIGKFLGITILNMVFLIIAGGLIYGNIKMMASKEIGVTPQEVELNKARINALVLTARKGIMPQKPGNIEEIAEQNAKQMLLEQLRRTPEMKNEPEFVGDLGKKLYFDMLKSLKNNYGTVPAGSMRLYKFQNVKVRPGDELIFLRYKMDVPTNPDKLSMHGEWWFGPKGSAEGLFFPRKTYQTIRTPHEIVVPLKVNDTNLISPEGDFYVAFVNPFDNQGIPVIFTEDTGLELLYTADIFETNLLRGLFLILLRLIYLTMVSLVFASCLSFPVAVLVVSVLYLLGAASSFILDAVDSEALDSIASVIRLIMTPIPHLATYDPVIYLEKGRMVDYSLIGKCLWMLILVKGGILFSVGYLLFRRKELARVVV